MTKLAIIIVNYNTRAELEACLRSIHEPRPAVSHDVVVVDNASLDGSADAVRSTRPNVHLIEPGENVGYARANNRAIRATATELILLLNSDTVVPRGAIDALVRELDAHPRVSVVGPRLVDGDGHPELSVGSMIGPFNEARQRLRGSILDRRIPLLSRWVGRTLSRRHDPDWVSGACLLVRRADADAAGLLDERFFLYGEDVDFCASVRRLGGRILFVPEIEVVHHRGRSGLTAPVRRQVAYRRSQLAFYAKHHPFWTPVLRLYLRVKGQLPEDRRG